jgi:WD40 repeat protein
MKSGYITSVTLLNNGKFLAVNNVDRTIHIFDLDINNNDFSFSNLLNAVFSDIKEIYPKLRIRYQNILQNEEIFTITDISCNSLHECFGSRLEAEKRP